MSWFDDAADFYGNAVSALDRKVKQKLGGPVAKAADPATIGYDKPPEPLSSTETSDATPYLIPTKTAAKPAVHKAAPAKHPAAASADAAAAAQLVEAAAKKKRMWVMAGAGVSVVLAIAVVIWLATRKR